MESCIYEGVVRHRRYRPIEHAFRYRLFMMYLDLAELDHVFDGSLSWTVEGRGLANFRRRDHHGDANTPLTDAIRDLVAERIGVRPEGPIRLLTHLAYFGHRFNPVSFYYCFDRSGRELQAIVAEINNTPWREQHCYVLDATKGDESDGVSRHRFDKTFHVSPFMDMNHQYDWQLSAPGERLNVFMENREEGEALFDAALTMDRREISPASLRALLIRYPLMTIRVVVAIYWQAAMLKLRRVPFFDHPAKRVQTTGTSR